VPPATRLLATLALAGLAGALLALTSGCGAPAEREGTADAAVLIDRAIAAQGGPVLDTATVRFVFRGTRFRLSRDGTGRFHYRRVFTDTQAVDDASRDSVVRKVVEGLTNDGVYRTVDGDTMALNDAERERVATAVNSVAYFALVPYPLDDPAVQPSYAGADTVRGVPYHRVRVAFRAEGGGADHHDRFCYWFDARDYSLDYLAYAYDLGPNDPEPGTRFREAVNRRTVGGVRFADYRNYTAGEAVPPAAICTYPVYLGTDSLRLVSTVALDSVRVAGT
jgi:hypothetical protein